MGISPTLTNFAGSISALSAIQPLDVRDTALLDLLIRDRFVGSDVVGVRPGSFATPATPIGPIAPVAPVAPGRVIDAAPSIDLVHVAPGDLISAAYLNQLVDALLMLDKRLAKLEAMPRQPVPATPSPPTPPPPVIGPVFTFELENDFARVELDEAEFEAADTIRIGDIDIARADVVVENGRARFNTPAALFRAGADNRPSLTLTNPGGIARTFSGMTRPVQ